MLNIFVFRDVREGSSNLSSRFVESAFLSLSEVRPVPLQKEVIECLLHHLCENVLRIDLHLWTRELIQLTFDIRNKCREEFESHVDLLTSGAAR